jgi:hypothetical protein
MAQRVQMRQVGALDGSAADETAIFGLDGRHYEIDLTASNARVFRAALKLYTRKARAGARRCRRRRPRRSGPGPWRTATRSPTGAGSTAR